MSLNSCRNSGFCSLYCRLASWAARTACIPFLVTSLSSFSLSDDPEESESDPEEEEEDEEEEDEDDDEEPED